MIRIMNYESWFRIFTPFILLFSPIHKYTISGNSMLPTLRNGETVLINRLIYIFTKPNIGDIVAVKDPGDRKILIKRIVKISSRKYFVEGDNKEHSTDSRRFGMLSRKDIIGKMIYHRKHH